MNMKTMIALLAMGFSPMAWTAQSCNQALGQLNGSFNSGNLNKVMDAVGKLRDDSDCNQATVSAGLRQASGVIAGFAQQYIDKGDKASAQALLDKAPAVHWAVQALRGDLAAAKKQNAEAARLYNSALDTITDPALTPQSNQLKPIVERLTKLARENMMLAGTLASALSRGGKPTGIMKLASRGIVIEADPGVADHNEEPKIVQPLPTQKDQIPGVEQPVGDKPSVVPAVAVKEVFLPIRFAFNSDHLDQLALSEANRLAKFLTNHHIKAILLEGHTDHIGNPHYNLDLSSRRAHALKAYLQEQGVTTHIKTLGKGENEPPEISDVSLYSEDQLRAIARRVEMTFIH